MIELRAMGDSALRATLPDGADLAAVLDALRSLPRVTDAVVTESHALVRFTGVVAHDDVRAAIVGAPRRVTLATERVVSVRYDGDDLEDVAARLGLTVDAVIDRHSGRVYEVLHLGFLPGFAYLGPLDDALVLPRRASPRAKVPAGSVAIAGARTGIYPLASPGGWHILGRALDFRPFDPIDGARLRLGDRVRFEAR